MKLISFNGLNLLFEVNLIGFKIKFTKKLVSLRTRTLVLLPTFIPKKISIDETINLQNRILFIENYFAFRKFRTQINYLCLNLENNYNIYIETLTCEMRRDKNATHR